MTDTIEKRKMNKTICPKCSREIYRLGYASHMEKHHREERELNKPKYSQIEVNELLSQAKEEERRKFIKIVNQIKTHEPGIMNKFIPAMDPDKKGDWISKYWLLQVLDGKENES